MGGCDIATAALWIRNVTSVPTYGIYHDSGIFSLFMNHANDLGATAVAYPDIILFPGESVTFVLQVTNPGSYLYNGSSCPAPPCLERYVVFADSASVSPFGQMVSAPTSFPLPPNGTPSAGFLSTAWSVCLYFTSRTPSTPTGTWTQPYEMNFSVSISTAKATSSNVTTEGGPGYGYATTSDFCP
jgi:hypothetical protein